MPPDSIAGLMALAAAPPGAASSTGPLLPEPLSASLFAAFLAQSGTAAPKAGVPKSTVALPPSTDRMPTLLDTQALPKSKTMDTLPTLSFPPTPKVKASGLLLHQILIQPAPVHHASAEAKPAPEAPPAGLLAASLTVAPFYAAFLPVLPAVFVLTPASVPTPAVSASPPAVPSVSAVPRGLETQPPATSSPITPSLATPSLATPSLATPSLAMPRLAMPRQVTSDLALSVPFRLPQTQTLTAPPALPQASPTLLLQVPTLAAPPLVTEVALNTDEVPELMALGAVKVKPTAVMVTNTPAIANALPRIASPVLTAPQAQVPNLAPQEPMTLPPVVIAAVPQGTPTQAAGVPSLASPSSILAKAPGTTAPGALAAALTPDEKNADTSNRMPQGQALKVIAKAGTPAAAPEPMSEKHAAEPESSGTAESGMNSGLPASPVGTTTNAIKADVKPLTAGERAQIVNQAADGLRTMPMLTKPGEAQQMSVQLHPKDWGSLQVSVTVAPSQDAGAAKTVTAHIVAETPQVKAALQSQTGALHQALRASGLRLEHLTVSVKAADAKIPEVKALEVKPAAQSASAGFSSGQGQSDKPGQSYGQPGAGANGFGPSSGTSGGAGGSQGNRQGQPQAFIPATTDAEPNDVPAAIPPLRLAPGRIDTHA